VEHLDKSRAPLFLREDLVQQFLHFLRPFLHPFLLLVLALALALLPSLLDFLLGPEGDRGIIFSF